MKRNIFPKTQRWRFRPLYHSWKYTIDALSPIQALILFKEMYLEEGEKIKHSYHLSIWDDIRRISFKVIGKYGEEDWVFGLDEKK